MRRRIAQLWRTLSVTGVLVGTLFFAASLTPSLVPRPFGMQGVLSGFSLAAGYAVGVFGRWLWSYLGLPLPRGRVDLWIKLVASAACTVIVIVFLREASEWQNSVRELMEMPPVEGTRPFSVGLIALGVFMALLGFARLFRLTSQWFAQRFGRVVPPHVSQVVAVAAAVALFWSLIDGVLYRFALQSADSSFQQLDALIEDELEAPQHAELAGSEASLIDWEGLGRQGRRHVSSGPTAAEIAAFHDAPALQPIRVYVGLNSADSVEARAQLALAELQRTGAFERSVLVIVTPTGTGWVDPAAMDTVAYLHRGDIASVAVQYSYLPSWLSLLSQSGYGAESARAVFHAVYDHWRALPRDERPQLYLHGLSLGALNSERSADIYDVVGDPYHGALWSGPPFRSETWRWITSSRNPGSPAWLPEFRDGSVIRFMNQHGMPDRPGQRWGPLRIVYLQYASDPITFFEPDALWREPEWMQAPRGPDVSPRLRWFPIVTMLQLGADIAAGAPAPVGYGHDYAAEHYIDGWVEVTDPRDWTAEDTVRLKRLFDHRSGRDALYE